MKNTLTAALKDVLLSLKFSPIDIVIQLPKNPDHGDYSTNIAMRISSSMDKNPRDIALLISKSLRENYPQLIGSAEVAGPGFINIRIKKEHIHKQLKTVLKRGKNFGRTEIGQGKRAQVEFVSANPTGPLTVGHGRGAILGDIVCNILEWNGYDVEREYYYNNAGKQMQRLGESVQARYLEILNEKFEFPENGYEGEYITDISREIQEKQGDSLKDSNDISAFKDEAEKVIFSGIQNTLKRIGLKFNNFFNEHSLYETNAIDAVMNSFRDKGIVYDKEGATWLKASAVGRNQDRVLIKSSGEPTYRLPDIAYHRSKFERGYDLIIDILGADHMDAYPDVLAGIEQLGYDLGRVRVLIHQFVTLTEKEGAPVKMSTRKAQYITLDELIDEVGSDVVRYFFIMRGMNTHLNFDLELAKDESDENPVFYLQYAHARLCNILKHAQNQGHKLDKKADLSLLTQELEIQLIQKIMEFQNVIEKAHQNLEPQSIANYLKDLAGTFHRYYARERVVTEDRDKTSARLVLVQALQIVLSNGLAVLGITAPERM